MFVIYNCKEMLELKKDYLSEEPMELYLIATALTDTLDEDVLKNWTVGELEEKGVQPVLTLKEFVEIMESLKNDQLNEKALHVLISNPKAEGFLGLLLREMVSPLYKLEERDKKHFCIILRLFLQWMREAWRPSLALYEKICHAALQMYNRND